MAKIATINLLALNLSAGTHSIAARAKATGYIDSAESNMAEYTVPYQTLTIINSNNEAETASFTMPEGYTFEDFIGSEYDTSGGEFAIADNGRISYRGYDLLDWEGYSAYNSEQASGTFYYAGEAEQITDLKGTTWYIPSSAKATAGYGLFNIDYSYIDPEGEYTNSSLVAIGYAYDLDDGWIPQSDSLCKGEQIDLVTPAYISITGGVDATNTRLIAWLTENGELQNKPLYVLSGKYVWDSAPNIVETNEYAEISFTSNGIQYTFIEIAENTIYYGDDDVYSSSDGWFIGDGYRIIDFGENPKVVSKEFFEAFTANVVKQEEYTLSGKWVWKKNPETFNGITESINFTSNGNSYASMSGFGDGIDYNSDTYTEVWERDTQLWTSDNYRIVDFGSTPQTVSKKFYEAFTANAVQEISGAWLWNEVLPTSLNNSDTWYIPFISNGETCVHIYQYDEFLAYYGRGPIIVYHYYDNEGWLDQAYRVFTLNEPVSANIYADFIMAVIDNATQEYDEFRVSAADGTFLNGMTWYQWINSSLGNVAIDYSINGTVDKTHTLTVATNGEVRDYVSPDNKTKYIYLTDADIRTLGVDLIVPKSVEAYNGKTIT